jgi:hypothetical protein
VIDLCPNWHDLDESLNFASINMSTVTGYIEMGTWLHEPMIWPVKDYNHQIYITTVSGEIALQVPQGSVTSLNSTSGNISAYLAPFSTSDPRSQSEILTSTVSGNTRVYVPATKYLGPGTCRYNSAERMFSRHVANSGNMTLRYGRDWFGRMRAKVFGKGDVAFVGDDLTKFEGDEQYIDAERGHGHSEIQAVVDEGHIDVYLGRWES